MLYLKILDLNNNINNGDWMSKNDLYVKIHYGNESRRTMVLWNNNNPKWNESFVFDINKEKEITFEICDEDVYSKSEILKKYKSKVNLGKIKKIKTDFLNIEMGMVNYKEKSELMELRVKNIHQKNTIKKQNEIISQIKTLCYNI